MATETTARSQTSNSNSVKTLEHPRLGVIEYQDQDRIYFPQGLLGFEKKKYYILVEREEYYPFVWMISTEHAETSFVMVNPLLFLPDYNPNISRRDLNELEIDNPQSLQMYVIVTLNRDAFQSTANLSGPILINTTKKIGKQLVLLDDKYSTKYRILKAD